MKYSRIALSVALCLPFTFSADAALTEGDWNGIYKDISTYITRPFMLSFLTGAATSTFSNSTTNILGINAAFIGTQSLLLGKNTSLHDKESFDKFTVIATACIGSIGSISGILVGASIKSRLSNNTPNNIPPLESPNTSSNLDCESSFGIELS